jgi:hypothetical protein
VTSASPLAATLARLKPGFFAGVLLAGLSAGGLSAAPSPTAASTFHETVQPLLGKYCYECHGEGMDKGNVVFDEFESDAAMLERHDLWQAVLKNVRAGMMPPPDKDVPRPAPAEIAQLENWIKFQAFGLDSAKPDPGRVTTRRLNRIEYRNTIRDLMGIDFNSEVEFPPDDSGNGFDNNGDVLTLSPLLMEKYLAAAGVIVDRAVPKVPRVMRERIATGRDFRHSDGKRNAEQLSAREPAKVSHKFTVDEKDKYRLVIELEARGSFDYDPGHCKVIGRVDGKERFADEVVWQDRKTLLHDFTLTLSPGEHTVEFEIVPLALIERPAAKANPATPTAAPATLAANASPAPISAVVNAVAAGPATPPPGAAGRGGAPGRGAVPAAPPAPTRLDVRVVSVALNGPVSPKRWVAPENHARFFPAGPAPAGKVERDQYAAEVLRRFAMRAFRRPVPEARVQQLVSVARQVYTQRGSTFEQGIGRAMMAVLASPRFLFRVEDTLPVAGIAATAPVDDYALASRLSYFLWSTMPDEELFALAAQGGLRAQLKPQVDRMLRDPKAQAFVRNFTGQWLQARDVEFVPINARVVLGPDAARNRDGRIEFDGTMRRLMRSETEMYFDYILREDRSVTELIDSDYTFLNATLARFYGEPELTGDELRRVQLSPTSPRGGVLTQGTVLAVTSNPTRTSPVKRGLFVLDNILGTPPPPPPPDVPALEEAKKDFGGREPRLSEMLERHRSDKLCNSCHQRMDPLGLAFENFNALGGWRDTEAGQPIATAGHLITGENFGSVRELKRVLANDRRMDFYRCLTEKLLTYAIGRGLDYPDVITVDQIVDRLTQADGRMSALVMGVIESAPFQQQRLTTSKLSLASPRP